MNQRILETLTGDFAAVTPALLVVNYKQGAVFIYSDGGKKVDAQLIKEWLGSVSAGSTPVTKHLAKGEWKPMHPGYDFLAMKEADKKRYVPERTRFDISPRQDMMSPQDTPLALNVGTEKVAASVDRPLHTEL
ncbi:hypothetical protein EB796_014200 [Bugula neritina]|uniref:Uncharacterized protein n=1 Tax=Bugula neritina TaxID=10212 RepID=A0A7J7JMB1_BUGNE|nr:hypothetical protein EB796_014200 [Bugula neritina]